MVGPGRIVETHTPAENYPTTDAATYLQFRCNYCLKKFYLVEPDNQHASGGVIQKEVLARDIETREISKVGRMSPVLMNITTTLN